MKDARDIANEGSALDASVSIAPSLLGRLKSGECGAWERLVDLYGPVVYSWCRRAGLSAEDAADVGQEVFQAIARGIAAFRRDRPGDTFRGWIWGILQHKLQDYWRRRQVTPLAQGGSTAQHRMLEIPDEQSSLSAAGSVQASDATGTLFHRCLQMIQAEFEPRTWQAFWAVAVDGRAPDDVASELKMSRNAVYVARSRVLRRLRQELGELIQ